MCSGGRVEYKEFQYQQADEWRRTKESELLQKPWNSLRSYTFVYYMLIFIKGFIDLLIMPIVFLVEITKFTVSTVKSFGKSGRWVAKESVKAGKLGARGVRGSIKFVKFLIGGDYGQALALLGGTVVKIGIFLGILAGLGAMIRFINQFMSNILP